MTSRGEYQLSKGRFILGNKKRFSSSAYELNDNKLVLKGRAETVYIKELSPPNPGELKVAEDKKECGSESHSL